MWFPFRGSGGKFECQCMCDGIIQRLSVSCFSGTGVFKIECAIAVCEIAPHPHHYFKTNLHQLVEDHLTAWRKEEWYSKTRPPTIKLLLPSFPFSPSFSKSGLAFLLQSASLCHSPFFHPRLKSHLFKKYLMLTFPHIIISFQLFCYFETKEISPHLSLSPFYHLLFSDSFLITCLRNPQLMLTACHYIETLKLTVMLFSLR